MNAKAQKNANELAIDAEFARLDDVARMFTLPNDEWNENFKRLMMMRTSEVQERLVEKHQELAQHFGTGKLSAAETVDLAEQACICRLTLAHRHKTGWDIKQGKITGTAAKKATEYLNIVEWELP